MKSNAVDVDYCAISSCDDFHNYEKIIQFKYKIVNNKQQLSKICDFITDNTLELDYDWYIKIRPDIKLLENINFDILSKNAINARARVYNGPLKIKHGMSVNGEGSWKNIGDCTYREKESHIVLDDQLYIFHKNIIEMGGFNKLDDIVDQQHEWTHTKIFSQRKISLNVVGINLCIMKYNAFSGDINIK